MRALAIILANFLWFDCQFVINRIKPKYDDLTNIYFIKTELRISFLTGIISSSNNFAADCIYIKSKEMGPLKSKSGS